MDTIEETETAPQGHENTKTPGVIKEDPRVLLISKTPGVPPKK
jgi:hypothetical protein